MIALFAKNGHFFKIEIIMIALFAKNGHFFKIAIFSYLANKKALLNGRADVQVFTT